jgi:hypothetical protein
MCPFGGLTRVDEDLYLYRAKIHVRRRSGEYCLSLCRHEDCPKFETLILLPVVRGKQEIVNTSVCCWFVLY